MLAKLLPLGFGILLLSWLVSQIEWEHALETIRHVPFSLLLIGFAAYGGSFYLRSWRFRLLLPTPRPLTHLFPIVLVHYTALNIIPARLGELSYVYLLNTVHGVSPGLSLSSLVVARVFDHLALSVLFLLSSVFVNISSSWLQTVNRIVLGGLAGTFVLLLLIIRYRSLCARWLQRTMHWLTLDRYRLIQRALLEMQKVVDALNDIPIRRYLGLTFASSLAIWLCIFTVNYTLFRAFNVPLSYLEVMFASTFMILLTVLPFQVFSGIGIRETAWVFIAGALSVPKEVAITAVIGSRIVVTFFLAVFGLVGIWSLRRAFRKTVIDKEMVSSINTCEGTFEE